MFVYDKGTDGMGTRMGVVISDWTSVHSSDVNMQIVSTQV